jgi:hypothetical protein
MALAGNAIRPYPAASLKPRKLKVADIPAALAAHDRAQEASDRIRTAAGLARLPENRVICEWRKRLAEKGSARPRKVAGDVSPIAELEAAVAARKRADARLRKAVRDARDAGESLQRVADALGVSRQAVHAQLSR